MDTVSLDFSMVPTFPSINRFLRLQNIGMYKVVHAVIEQRLCPLHSEGCMFCASRGLTSPDSTPLTVDAALERHQSADEFVDVIRRGESYQKEVHETIQHAMENPQRN